MKTLNKITASWAVEYQDGSWLSQWESDHPKAVSGEVPYRAIDWDRLKVLRFESSVASVAYEIPPAPAGLAWSLRSRTWLRASGADPEAVAGQVTAFMIVLAVAGQPVTPDTVKYVKFWFPDGTEHDTPIFNSPAAAEYGSGIVAGLQPTLMPSTDQITIQANALLQ